MIEGGDEESPMVEHTLKCHRGEEAPEYVMEVKEVHPTPLQRQAREGFLISVAKQGTTLNRKGEWGQNLPPKITIDGEEDDEEGSGRKRKMTPGSKEKVERKKDGREKEDKEDRDEDDTQEGSKEVGKEVKEDRPRKKRKVLEGSQNVDNVARKPLAVKDMMKRMNIEGRERKEERKKEVTTLYVKI